MKRRQRIASVLPAAARPIIATTMSIQSNGNRTRRITKGINFGIAAAHSGMIETVNTADTPRPSRMRRHGVLQLTPENSTTAVTDARAAQPRIRSQ